MAEKQQDKVKIAKLRHAEYYGQQEILDELYKKSKEGKTFSRLMELVTSDENIKLAYRNIKGNRGSNTPGTDKITIKEIEKLEVSKFCHEVRRRLSGCYSPKAVRRKDIPKANGKTRPLGIPSIWDRIIQQCILQILEPICEAKFSEHSYGFRPLRSAENAIAEAMRYINRSKLYYVVEVDIESFFDNVDHPKLIRQIWAMGIRDTKLICIIKAILKAPIKMPNGEIVFPTKGTPQGGVLSPLLANIVLNELDRWIESQWEENPVVYKYNKAGRSNKSGTFIKSDGYDAMRKTNLKEMKIVRYADDFRIFCKTKSQADKCLIAVTDWLQERLKLNVSKEKTRVVNLNRHYTEFLGIKMKLTDKGNKKIVKSHMSDKSIKRTKDNLKDCIKAIQKSVNDERRLYHISNYNAKVRGIHEYFSMATCVVLDCTKIARDINKAMRTRLLSYGYSKQGTMKSDTQDYKKYGHSKQIRYVSGHYLLPIGFVKTENALHKKNKDNIYTEEGRESIHKTLGLWNRHVLEDMQRNPVRNRSAKYNDNRISLFAAQYGRCAITGYIFKYADEVHAHHKIPTSKGGTDDYNNLILVTLDVHLLIHATEADTTDKYLKELNLTREQLSKLNKLRKLVDNKTI